MVFTYNEIETKIPNTKTEEVYLNGVLKLYRITPNDGYVLHDKNGDSTLLDEETGLPYTLMRYGRGAKTCGYNYDFTSFEMTAEGLTVTAYGNREFFAIPRDVIQNPVGQIYGGGIVTPPTEIM